MTFFQAIVLALVQGFTEFLPISSSAHLILPSQVLGWPDQGLAFDVAVHLGTLSAVVMYYRADLLAMFGGALRGVQTRQMNEDLRLGLLVVLATVPAIVAGLVFKDLIETQLRAAMVIVVTTLLFGAVLWLADVTGKRSKTLSALNWRDAVLVGLAQALALIPGTSRSGITITAALFLGYQREQAARFSFLLSIPVILGAATLKLKDLLESPLPVDWVLMASGYAVSAITAYLTIVFFLRMLDRLGMLPWVIYRFVLGGLLLWMLY
ncbi:MAG: undecaprenyl-diphosphate phosphatase [Alcanivoracaceae bacterium]|nr:undecaprenyl-diphosphate phosphatase [Alcanivoracaceae bacterium]